MWVPGGSLDVAEGSESAEWHRVAQATAADGFDRGEGRVPRFGPCFAREG